MKIREIIKNRTFFPLQDEHASFFHSHSFENYPPTPESSIKNDSQYVGLLISKVELVEISALQLQYVIYSMLLSDIYVEHQPLCVGE